MRRISDIASEALMRAGALICAAWVLAATAAGGWSLAVVALELLRAWWKP